MTISPLNLDSIEDQLLSFIKKECKQAGYEKVVLGISGGVDSAVTAALCAKSLGASKVLAVMMPYTTSSPESLEDARLLTKTFHIPSEVQPIGDAVNAFFKDSDNPTPIRRGNVMARMRMIQLYDLSARDHRLVVGTSNKTEIFLGYGTLYGDTASAMIPLADLYKTDVFKLAAHLGIPQSIINKPPSADLWKGQTDEDELGFTYEAADRILYLLKEANLSESKILQQGINPETLEKIKAMVHKNAFKQAPPLAPKLSS